MSDFIVGQEVNVKDVELHDGIGTIESIQNTHGPHGNIYTVVYGKKQFKPKKLRNTANDNHNAAYRATSGTVVTGASHRTVPGETRVPRPSQVFAYQLESV